MKYISIYLTILFTVYGQLIIKWQVGKAGPLPEDFFEKLRCLLGLVFNGWIMSGLFAAFLASLAWMAALSKFPLSYAYPFMGLVFALLLIGSIVLFQESVTAPKLIGTALIICGVVIASQ